MSKILYWMGSEDSYEAYTKALPLAEARKAEWEARTNKDNSEPEFPPLYELMGDVGVVKISGSLIPGEAGWLRYFGITGYEDIKAAMLEGLADKSAKTLMIYSDSGGGSVAGVQDAEDFISKVSKLKPMNAYSEFSASAAYWLTSVASHITTGPTSVNGSLGVLRIVTDYSKAFEKEGITKTVMRAGRYKALANGYEPLTEEAKSEIQAKLDDLYDMFISTVARNRGTTEIIADQVMGQGREFLGKRGLEAGLVDAIGTFDEALAYAKSNRTLTTKNATNFRASATAGVAQASAVADNAATSNHLGSQMHLTPEQLAAIAAGASVEQVTGQTGKSPEELAADAAAAAEAAAEAADADAKEEAEAKAAAEAALAEANPDLAAAQAAVATAEATLAEAQAENATLQAQAQTLSDKVTALEGDLAAVSGVVQASVNSLNIILCKTVDVTKLSATELVAAHAEAAAATQEKFKVGGVARSTASTQKEPESSIIAPRDAAAIKQMFNPRKR